MCVLLRAPENRNDTSHNDPKYNALHDYDRWLSWYMHLYATKQGKQRQKNKQTNNKINATKQTKNYLAAVEALLWSTVNDTIFSLPMLSIYLNLLKCIISNQ